MPNSKKSAQKRKTFAHAARTMQGGSSHSHHEELAEIEAAYNFETRYTGVQIGLPAASDEQQIEDDDQVDVKLDDPTVAASVSNPEQVEPPIREERTHVIEPPTRIDTPQPSPGPYPTRRPSGIFSDDDSLTASDSISQVALNNELAKRYQMPAESARRLNELFGYSHAYPSFMQSRGPSQGRRTSVAATSEHSNKPTQTAEGLTKGKGLELSPSDVIIRDFIAEKNLLIENLSTRIKTLEAEILQERSANNEVIQNLLRRVSILETGYTGPALPPIQTTIVQNTPMSAAPKRKGTLKKLAGNF